MFLAADIGDSAQRGANEIGAWVPTTERFAPIAEPSTGTS